MRLLLISDTHGILLKIDALAESACCDAVLHAGDFGFYDEYSPESLSEREIKIIIRFSNLSDREKTRLLNLSSSERLVFLQKEWPISDLSQFLSGHRKFMRPVYAVWGNHEDIRVVNRFRCGSYKVHNLNVLDENNVIRAGNLEIIGLGGNVILSPKFFHLPIAGKKGKIWSSIWQYIALIDQFQGNKPDDLRRVVVSHVSPGKEPLVSLLGICLQADFVVSGHMDPDFPQCWSEFSIRHINESVLRIEKWLQEIQEIANELGQKEQLAAFKLKKLFDAKKGVNSSLIKRKQLPSWYNNMYYINLPDFGKGQAIFDFNRVKPTLEMSSQPSEI